MFLRPTYYTHRITDLTAEKLNELGINSLILDVDNTLSTHHGQTPLDGLSEWLSYIQSSGIKLVVVSNSNAERVKPFAEKLGLAFFASGAKPLSKGFKKAKDFLGEDKKCIAAVGDQLFTDIIGGNWYKIKTILVEPILVETKIQFKIKRFFERIIYKILKVDVKV